MKLRTIISVALAACVCHVANASRAQAQISAPLLDDLRSCARIQDSLQRLVCFDALVAEAERVAGTPVPLVTPDPPPRAVPESSLPASPSATTVVPSPSATSTNRIRDWRVAQTVDPMTDRVRPFIAASGVMELGRGEDPSLYFRCIDGRLEGFVTVGTYIGAVTSFRMRIRFDDRVPVMQSWSSSTNGQGAFSPNPRQLLEESARSRVVLIEITAYSGSRHVAAFPVEGLTEAAATLSECYRPAVRPTAPARPNTRP